MALPASGQLSLQDIATEFGGTTPHAISEYYSAAAGIPASGEITISDFYGASASPTPPPGPPSSVSASLMSRSGQYSTTAWEGPITIDLAPYIGQTGRLAFWYETTTSFTADVQLDAIDLNNTQYNFESTSEGWITTTTDRNTTSATVAHVEANLATAVTVPTGTTAGRWLRDSGGTPSSGTGLTGAAVGSWYIYAEASVSHPYSFWLFSPEVTLTTGTCSLYMARYGATMGTINAYWYDTAQTYSIIYGQTDNKAFPVHSSTSISATANLGTAYGDREIWIAITTMNSGSTAGSAVSSVTVGGNAASIEYEHVAGSYTNSICVAFARYIDNGALGASATIAVTFANSRVHSGFVVYSSNATRTIIGTHGADASAGGTPTAGSIATTTSGWAIYAGMKQNSTSATVNYFNNDFSFDAGSNEWMTVGYVSQTDGSSLTVENMTGTTTGATSFAAISVS